MCRVAYGFGCTCRSSSNASATRACDYARWAQCQKKGSWASSASAIGFAPTKPNRGWARTSRLTRYFRSARPIVSATCKGATARKGSAKAPRDATC